MKKKKSAEEKKKLLKEQEKVKKFIKAINSIDPDKLLKLLALLRCR